MNKSFTSWLKSFWLNEKIATFFIAIALVAAGLRLFYFISIYSVDIPFTDQWQYFSTIWHHEGVIKQFLFQLGPHRMGLEFILSSIILEITNWNIQALAYLGGLYLFLAALAALFLKRLVTGRLTIIDSFIPFLVMSLMQHGILVTDPFPGYAPFPLLLLFLYCLSWKIKNLWKRYIAVVVLNFFLLFGGFGLVVTPITILFLMLEYVKTKKKIAVQRLNLALFAVFASLVCFFWNYTLNASVGCFKFPDSLGSYLIYISSMFANIFAILRYMEPLWAIFVGLFSFFGLIYLALLSFWKFRLTGSYANRVLFILFAYSILFTCLAAIGRSCLGPDQAQSSRYFAYLIPAALGVYMVLSKQQIDRLKMLLILVFVALIMRAEVLTYAQDKLTIEEFSVGKKSWIACYLKYDDRSFCSEKLNFFLHPSRWEWIGDPNTEFGFAYLKNNNYSFFRQP